MAKQPTLLIIVRHGARLDQVDRHWHETAEKTYDPPLTYGGWLQCQTLGARIATELENIHRSEAPEERPAKKRKIIIHSSPYLRCVQTSIAVGAGLKRAPEAARGNPKSLQRSTLSKRPELPTIQSASNLADLNTSSRREAQPEKSLEKSSDTSANKPTLRLDPFLGEWLSPSYFEDIKPPPSSTKLLASVKDMLKAPAEDIRGADVPPPAAQDFGDVEWPNYDNEVASAPVHEKTGLRAMAAVGHGSLANRPRTASLDTATGPRVRQGSGTFDSYTAPVPTYAIAPSGKIPPGFVAHARNACISPDIDWNSMMTPLFWGDGGEYGEEWSSMHRRFRNGLQKMLEFYDGPGYTPTSTDEDLVIILVTHQAGCNALIRLITGAPALHDVGTASLTMAVRNESAHGGTQQSTSTTPTSKRRGSLDLGLSETYSMKIIASTEHLRQGSNPLSLSASRLGVSTTFASRRTVGADASEGFSAGDPLTWPSNFFAPSGCTRSTRGTPSGLGRSSSLQSPNHTRNNLNDESHTWNVSPTGLWGSGGHEPAQISGRAASISTPSTSIHIPSEDVVSRSGSEAGSPIELRFTQTKELASDSKELLLMSERNEKALNLNSRIYASDKSTTIPRRPSEQREGVEGTALSARTTSQSQDQRQQGLWGSSRVTGVNGNGLWGSSIPTYKNEGGGGSINRARSPGKRRFTEIDK